MVPTVPDKETPPSRSEEEVYDYQPKSHSTPKNVESKPDHDGSQHLLLHIFNSSDKRISHKHGTRSLAITLQSNKRHNDRRSGGLVWNRTSAKQRSLRLYRSRTRLGRSPSYDNGSCNHHRSGVGNNSHDTTRLDPWLSQPGQRSVQIVLSDRYDTLLVQPRNTLDILPHRSIFRSTH